MRPSQSRFQLGKGSVRVFYCALTEFFSLPGLLSQGEMDACKGIKEPHAAQLALRSKAARRLLLSKLCGVPPESLLFETGPYGKPFLTGGPSFSVSHCKDRFALAVCAEAAVGVDVEDPARLAAFDAVGRKIMCGGELAEFSALGAVERRAFFMRVWTAKEAALKAAGTGFQADARLVDARHEGPLEMGGAPYFLARLPLPDGFSGAVCVAGKRPREIIFTALEAGSFPALFSSPA